MKRRLAAILAADMVGYSRLMSADEDGTIARQKACLDGIVEPAIAALTGHSLDFLAVTRRDMPPLRSFDHLVGVGEECRRNFESKRPRVQLELTLEELEAIQTQAALLQHRSPKCELSALSPYAKRCRRICRARASCIRLRAARAAAASSSV